VDTYDYQALTPQSAVAQMQAHGVRTLYLGTARFNTNADFAYPNDVDAWLQAAHSGDIRVVGWYVPEYSNVATDVNRTLAIARYRGISGQRFDGLGIDIEYPAQVADPVAWNAAVGSQLAQVRAATTMPIGAIVLPPLLMSAWPDKTWPDKNRWVTFPWAVIGKKADALLLMNYWTSYTPAHLCPTNPQYCVAAYTSANVQRGRDLTGLPIHAIGGVGGNTAPGDTALFAQTAHGAGAVGGSFYDLRTTSAQEWTALQTLR
jgi:hypothetical protein